MPHPTTSIGSEPDTASIVLVGPPACGKSTVRQLLSDYGVTGLDLDQYYSDGEKTITDRCKQAIEATIVEGCEQKPHIACFEGAVTPEEISFIDDRSSSLILIRVDVSDQRERVSRYVEQHLPDTDDVVDDEAILDLEEEAMNRHINEQPYPQHDVRILNEQFVSTTELTDRCGRIVDSISSPSYTVETPEDHTPPTTAVSR